LGNNRGLQHQHLSSSSELFFFFFTLKVSILEKYCKQGFSAESHTLLINLFEKRPDKQITENSVSKFFLRNFDFNTSPPRNKHPIYSMGLAQVKLYIRLVGNGGERIASILVPKESNGCPNAQGDDFVHHCNIWKVFLLHRSIHVPPEY
jgi:hypothetical protein